MGRVLVSDKRGRFFRAYSHTTGLFISEKMTPTETLEALMKNPKKIFRDADKYSTEEALQFMQEVIEWQNNSENKYETYPQLSSTDRREREARASDSEEDYLWQWSQKEKCYILVYPEKRKSRKRAKK